MPPLPAPRLAVLVLVLVADVSRGFRPPQALASPPRRASLAPRPSRREARPQRRRQQVVLRALYYPPFRDQMELLLRLGVAGIAGATLGFERRATRKASSPVGVRTMTLVSIGSALFTVAGLAVPRGDASRVAASAATGVGFLGAGVITVQRDGRSIDGLTTAATIWMASALGVASGTGLCYLVGAATMLSTLVLRVPRRLVLRSRGRGFTFTSLPPDGEDDVDDSDLAQLAS